MDQEEQKSQRCEMKIEEICDVSKAKRLLTKSKLVGGFATLFLVVISDLYSIFQITA